MCVYVYLYVVAISAQNFRWEHSLHVRLFMTCETQPNPTLHFDYVFQICDRLCGLVVRVPGYRFRGPGSILSATRFFEKYFVWNRVHSAS
jgi:hypothetical protein